MTNARPSVEIDHYRPGDIVWMFDAGVIRKVRVEQVQIDIRPESIKATHLVEGVECYSVKAGVLELKQPSGDIWRDRILWQWPATSQLHANRDGALADMRERIKDWATA